MRSSPEERSNLPIVSSSFSFSFCPSFTRLSGRGALSTGSTDELIGAACFPLSPQLLFSLSSRLFHLQEVSV